MSAFSLSPIRLWQHLSRSDSRPALNDRYRSLLPRSDMLRCRCFPLRFEGNVLYVATDSAHAAATEELLLRHSQEPNFQRQLGVRGPVAYKVEIFRPEDIDTALQSAFKTTPTTLQIDFQLAPLLPIEYARTYRMLLCRVIGTQVVFAVEGDDGRKLAEQLIHHGELSRQLALRLTGNEDFAQKLRVSIQMVPTGLIDDYFKQIYGLDLTVREKLTEAAENLRETVRAGAAGTTTARLDPNPRNDIETMLTSVLGRLKEEKFSDLRISYDFDAQRIEFSARQNGRYETIERVSLPNEIFARLAQWIFTNADIATPLSEPADGSLTFRQVLLPGSRRYEDVTVRMSYLPLLDPRHRHAPCNGRFSFRLINDGDHFMALDQLGYTPAELADMGQIIRIRSGLVLLVGEMGSGKSATANALLARKAEQERGLDFVSLERPVEYRNPFISQVELRPDGAAEERTSPLRYLKTLVRQGTNGVFLGEIGEGEMAQMVTTMALTGVYVVSTFHATSPFTALYRLSKPPFNVSALDLATMIGAVIHQCLVSESCPTCAVPDTEWRDRLRQLDPTGQTLQLIERYLETHGWVQDVDQAYHRVAASYAEQHWDEIPPKLRYQVLGRLERPTGDPEACALQYRALGEVVLPRESFIDWLQKENIPIWQPTCSRGVLPDGTPCPDCVGKGKKPGIRGRMALPEIWIPTEKERLMIEREGLSPLALRDEAMRRGHRTRFMAALERIASGRLSLTAMIEQMGIPSESDLFPISAAQAAAKTGAGSAAAVAGRSGETSHTPEWTAEDDDIIDAEIVTDAA